MAVNKKDIEKHLLKECLNCHRPLTKEELNKNVERYSKKIKILLPGKLVSLCDDCQKLREEGKIEFFNKIEDNDE